MLLINILNKCILLIIGNKSRGFPSSFQSVSCGHSFSGSSQERENADLHNSYFWVRSLEKIVSVLSIGGMMGLVS